MSGQRQRGTLRERHGHLRMGTVEPPGVPGAAFCRDLSSHSASPRWETGHLAYLSVRGKLEREEQTVGKSKARFRRQGTLPRPGVSLQGGL